MTPAKVEARPKCAFPSPPDHHHLDSAALYTVKP